MTTEERIIETVKKWLQYNGRMVRLVENAYGTSSCYFCGEDWGDHTPDCFGVALIEIAKEQGWVHDWKRLEDGCTDYGAWGITTEASGHHGPECVRCGYHYCEHCQQEKVLCPAESEPL